MKRELDAGPSSAVFRWYQLDGKPYGGIIAMALMTGFFAFFLAAIRIRVTAPRQWSEQKASVLYLPSGAEGKAWALRAKEGGPFPSRIDPELWQDLIQKDESFLDSPRIPLPPYQPVLRELPAENPVPPIRLSARDSQVLPKLAPPSELAVPPVPTRLVPKISPICDRPAEATPLNSPSFNAPVDAVMAAVSWRFLLRLRPDGSVSECAALVSDSGENALGDWLRSLTFNADFARNSEWLAVGVEFTNQAADGPDAK